MHGISNRVGFIEGITGKLFHVSPYLSCRFLVDAVSNTPLNSFFFGSINEAVPVFIENRLFLFAHSLAYRIHLSAREAGHVSGQKHYLLLIKHDSECRFQLLLHAWMIVGGFRWIENALIISADILIRSRAHKGIDVTDTHEHFKTEFLTSLFLLFNRKSFNCVFLFMQIAKRSG